jgi:hypothetical protein
VHVVVVFGKMLYAGITKRGLTTFDGRQRRRQFAFIDDPAESLRLAQSRSVFQKSKGVEPEFYVPVVIVLTDPALYKPKRRENDWLVNFYHHPINYRSEDVVVLENPTLDQILTVQPLLSS